MKLKDLSLNVNILLPKKLFTDAIMKEIIFDKDLEIRKKSDNKIYTIISISNEIIPIIEYDINCL